MGTRGRRSAASLTVIGGGAQELERIPEPPKDLTADQQETWRMVIASRGGDLIDPEAFPVLAEYCRAVSAANQIASQLDRFDPSWAADDDGLKRWDKLLAMQERAQRISASLAAKLRLTPSSRVQAISAGRNADKGAKRKPWEG